MRQRRPYHVRTFGIVGALDRQRRQQEPPFGVRRKSFLADDRRLDGLLALRQQVDLRSSTVAWRSGRTALAACLPLRARSDAWGGFLGPDQPFDAFTRALRRLTSMTSLPCVGLFRTFSLSVSSLPRTRFARTRSSTPGVRSRRSTNRSTKSSSRTPTTAVERSSGFGAAPKALDPTVLLLAGLVFLRAWLQRVERCPQNPQRQPLRVDRDRGVQVQAPGADAGLIPDSQTLGFPRFAKFSVLPSCTHSTVFSSCIRRSVWCRCGMFSTVTASPSGSDGSEPCLIPFAAHVNACIGASAWYRAHRRALRRASPSDAPPNSCSAHRSRPAPTSNGARRGSGTRRCSCHPASSSYTAFGVSVAACARSCRPRPAVSRCQPAARKLIPVCQSSSVSSRHGARLEIFPQPAMRRPHQITQLAAHQRTGAVRMLLLQHRDHAMLVIRCQTRPSTAPISPGTLFGGGTGSAKRRGRRTPPPECVREGSEIRPAASNSASSFRQPARCRRPTRNSNAYAIRDLAATGEDLVRQQTLQARKIIPKALPNLILELHAPNIANRLAGVQQNLYGAQAALALPSRLW